MKDGQHLLLKNLVGPSFQSNILAIYQCYISLFRHTYHNSKSIDNGIGNVKIAHKLSLRKNMADGYNKEKKPKQDSFDKRELMTLQNVLLFQFVI